MLSPGFASVGFRANLKASETNLTKVITKRTSYFFLSLPLSRSYHLQIWMVVNKADPKSEDILYCCPPEDVI